VPLRARILRLTDGRFRNRGPMENGIAVDIGRTAVLEAGNLRVVIAETCQSANDPAWCDLHGIDLAEVELFLVKAKNHFRAGFAPLCRAMIDIEAPGPAPADLRLVPFRHVPRVLIAQE
jgi:microcystin degradation protein MlrC